MGVCEIVVNVLLTDGSNRVAGSNWTGPVS